MPLGPAQVKALEAILNWLWNKAPGCALALFVSLASIWIFSQNTFATTEDVDRRFEAIILRLDVSDATNTVTDLQSQVRQKEREVADLEVILADIPPGDAANTLRSRVFTIRQDLSELRSTLAAESQALQQARREYNGSAP